MDVITAFLGIGTIIFLGFIGVMIFEKTKVPDVLLLIFIGLFIGPILAYFFNITLISPDILQAIAPYFGALALIIILFEGGLDLDFDQLLSYFGVAVLHTVIIFTMEVVSVALVLYFFVGMPLMVGLLMGTVVAGITGAIVIPLISGTSASGEAKTVILLESILTDVLCIVSALTVIGILRGGNVDAGAVANNILMPFAVAGLIGALFGMFWLGVLKKVEGKPLSYMITMAALFFLYAATEYIKANGAIAVLVFGIVLANKDEFARIFKIKTKLVVDESIEKFHTEISFLVKVFFFVYLGMVFTFQLNDLAFSPRLALPGFLTSSTIIFFIIVLALILTLMMLARTIGSTISTSVKKKMKPDRGLMITLIPKGLTAAVLAQIPFTYPEYVVGNEYYDTLSPYRPWFVNLPFMIIVTSVIITAIGVYTWERRYKAKHPAPQPPREPTPEEKWQQKSRIYRKYRINHQPRKIAPPNQQTQTRPIQRAVQPTQAQPKPPEKKKTITRTKQR